MPKKSSVTGSELFIVDNSEDDWEAVRYLHDWCQLSRGIDIATGYFEIGALLALQDEWQKVDKVRILMGDEVSARTKDAFEKSLSGICSRLDASLVEEKEKNDFLAGVPAVVDAMRTRKIECRVYRRDKFHAKAYITHARLEVVGSSALVGSSNFTRPGITKNIELNVQITGRPVAVLQEWYEKHWDDAEDVTADVLRVLERHVRDYAPFEVYARSLQLLLDSDLGDVDDWERNHDGKGSTVYNLLDGYQQQGYKQLRKIAARYNGAFLCDGVGLGKTFVGLMLIEWLVRHARKRVALFVPKATRGPVWEASLDRYLGGLGDAYGPGVLIFNHTDLGRDNDAIRRQLDDVRRVADAVIIDEAHHFRNRGTAGSTIPFDVSDPSKPGPSYIPGEGKVRPSRYRRLYDILGGFDGQSPKTLFLLTATPISNGLSDLRHMIELFSRERPDYFKAAPLGIHSLPGHFRQLNRQLQETLGRDPSGDDAGEAARMLGGNALFNALVVQRSRAYIRKSQQQAGGRESLFPSRLPPAVAPYKLEATYGRLLNMVEQAFDKEAPLFYLPIYYPLKHWKGPPEELENLQFEAGRQGQVVSLVRTSFLKRFESSVDAFDQSCRQLLRRILAWVEVHVTAPGALPVEKKRFRDWQHKHADLVGTIQRDATLFDDDDDEDDKYIVPRDMLDKVEQLDRKLYDLPTMLHECYSDLNQLADFLAEAARFDPSHDDKRNTLIALVTGDQTLRTQKVLIFTEYRDTAVYLHDGLRKAGVAGLEQVDGSSGGADRGDVVRRFSPWYNGTTPADLAARGEEEIRVLIATDVLSEGLNLQDATRLINYDLHWNPVRLMQRIGRVDRRMNPEIEARIAAEHPDRAAVRGEVKFWNFLPPDELNRLLSLYQKVTHKTLLISKTQGIEGSKLLTPDDEYDALKDFNEAYEGEETPLEAVRLELQALFAADPTLENRLNAMPDRIFSGKSHPERGGKAVFFCYARPGPDKNGEWSQEAGDVAWYLHTLADGKTHEVPVDLPADEVAAVIRSTPQTPRRIEISDDALVGARRAAEGHIRNTYLRSAQAPVGVKPVLKAWMELN